MILRLFDFSHYLLRNEHYSFLWMEAISARRSDETYSREMLLRLKDRVSDVIREIFPANHETRFTRQNLLSHLLFVAFDGFTINYHASGKFNRAEAIAELLTTTIFAEIKN
ncbi:MAG: hypothetical protein VYA17_14485 [Pseudomonadota bacterium]|nr:hypothetical protein [Pseudomonadota bacterium]